MKITDIRLRLIPNEDSKLKAVASITIDDCFVVHDIKVINTKDKLFIVMPSRKNADNTYRDIAHPINADFRTSLEKAVIEAYEAKLNEAEPEAATFIAETN